MSVNSIILKSQLESIHRIDAEYYQPEYLQVEKKLNSIKTHIIDDIANSVINFGAYSLCNYIEFVESGVPYLNVNNIRDGYIDFEDVKFIDKNVDEILKKSRVKEGQIIITMAGTIGNTAVAHKIAKQINSNQATAKITLKSGYSPYFLSAFLNSYYGRKQTERDIVSSVQPNIFLWQIKNFKIPLVSKELENKIEQIYIQGLDKLELSERLYSQAESLLLEKLGLKDYKPQDELSCVVNLSEAKSVYRIDAEYYQPKYKKLLSIINKFNKQPFHHFIKKYGTGYPFESNNYQAEGIPLIRINNIKKSLLDLSDTVFLSEDDFNLAPKEIAKAGDVVLGMSGTIGFAAIIPDDVPKCSINQRILHFTPQNAEPLYLLVLINSLIGNLQLQRIGTGGVQTNISYRDIKNISIPLLPNGKQKKIAELVRQSHEARKKAKELLDEAKRKVEEEIEKGSS